MIDFQEVITDSRILANRYILRNGVPFTSITHPGNVYDAIVSKDFLDKSDNVLVIDDFLAKGNALNGLIDIINQSGATLCGCAIAIEKGFQGGGDELRAKGIRIDSLAIIDEMDEKSIKFRS